ncbi:MAG: hypothetical protein EA417_10590 [Gammaproteobacteria bacterium]|nr:MAG: hypothetical protein EA417_10590 [Gammaproteobacteria bacterium]
MTAEDRHEDRSASGPMQGLLSHFCEALEHGLSPLLKPISEVADDFNAQATAVPAVLPPMREVADQISLLVDKMAEQQAYVLIFGPLKSGKSTLMNAICGKYVSEVSCLPAYPCLVHVAHAEQTRFQVTRYNGSTNTIVDEPALAQAVADDHKVLVEALRSCEAAGIDFEPQQHATTAIRRIDIRVPAGDLAQSGAVLVDTPGLYTRMKFGYDRMTRDFRNAAACAIFVVKTDNLFLDQVFAEFEDLLELFGRIFLVVNLDSTKQDLQSDGTLAPSLEHADPQAIVRAFENLAMTAPLREARQDGRLQIYPVDLLRAASGRIGRQEQEQVEAEGARDFAALLEDLTEYLNSNEYLRGFVADGLQRAAALLDDLGDLLEHRDVLSLQGRGRTLAERKAQLESADAALDRIVAIDWRALAARQGALLRERVESEIEPLRSSARQTLHDALAAWFENDSSLAALCRDSLAPELERVHEELGRLLRDECESQLGPAAAMADLDAEPASDLETAGVDLASALRDVLDERPLAAGLPTPVTVLDSLQLPVRRRIIDWLLLRRPATVRRYFFGPPEAPEIRLTAAEKARRLGDSGREAMADQLDALLEPMFECAGGSMLEAWVSRHQGELAAQLDRRSSERRAAILSELDEVSAELAQVQRVVDRLGALRQLAAQRSSLVSALMDELAALDPSALGRPLDFLAASETEVDTAEDARV